MSKQISSAQNPTIKKLSQLQGSSRARRKEGLFVIEGLRELQLALKAGYEIETLFYDSTLIVQDQVEIWAPQAEHIEIASALYAKLAYRGSTEGVLAFAKAKSHELSDLSLKNDPLILVAESPEKPGNIGALLRTADAAGIDAVCIANPKTDLYNPNIIRSSVGALFTVPIAIGSTAEIISVLQDLKIAIYSAILQEAIPYTQADYKKASALVVGTEDEGLSMAWREASEQNIIIPMNGQLDSMNVSVAAAVLIFEAVRQRQSL
ncbi:TrmH family RNA methyltransferase [Croceiramulus getboli]|nr:RNA methyltransferase [Flavobacteriaceae bacterium YJPT1-3]